MSVPLEGSAAHTVGVTNPVVRSLDEIGDLLKHPSTFRPSVVTSVRENLSVLRVAGRIIQQRPAPTEVDLDRVPVLLVPGFGATDIAMAPMAEVLRRQGHRTFRSGIGPNIGCTVEVADALERRLEVVAERSGERVALVGWSRGGTLGKLVTVRRPDLVECLITLGTPNTHPLAVSETLAAQIGVLARLRALGIPGVLGEDCLSGDCARSVMAVLEGDFPPGIRYVSLFSMDDGVIDWRACLDPEAEHLEVHATHMRMGADDEVIEIVRDLLAPMPPHPLA